MDLLLSICVILALLLTVTLPVARVTPLRHAFDLKYSKVSDRQKGALHPLCCCQLSCRPEGDIQSNASHRQKQQPRPCSVKVPASRQVSSQGLVLGLMQKAGFGALDHHNVGWCPAFTRIELQATAIDAQHAYMAANCIRQCTQLTASSKCIDCYGAPPRIDFQAASCTARMHALLQSI